MKEIERKFKLAGWPNQPHLNTHYIKQSYLSVEPELRIRSKRHSNAPEPEYKLAYKSDGTISRIELQLSIPKWLYNRLLRRCPQEPIDKEYRRYRLPDGDIAEVSHVDGDFYYAEVEFNSEKKAHAFQPPEWFGEEITSDPFYKMKNYWKRSRLDSAKKASTR